jgi:hypothetical protein
MLNITQIPAPRVEFIDSRTGLMSREWYRFFLNLFTLTGGGTNQVSLEDVQLGPAAEAVDVGALVDQSQLANLTARYETLDTAIQALALTPQVQVGTLAYQNAASVVVGALAASTIAAGNLTLSGVLSRGAPVTKTADFTLAAIENWVINDKAAAACVVTLPAASLWAGREVMVKTIQAFALNSAASDVVPLAGGAAGTTILTGTAGKWATLVSDGSNWVIMAGN